MQNKVSAVPEEDLRFNRHRGGEDSSPYQMPHCGRTVRLEWLVQTSLNP